MSDQSENTFADVDKKKAAMIMRKIILEEANNLKTKGCSDSAMVKNIQKMIQEGVQCF